MSIEFIECFGAAVALCALGEHCARGGALRSAGLNLRHVLTQPLSKKRQQTILHCAAAEGNLSLATSVLEMLGDLGQDVASALALVDGDGGTPLHIAAAAGQILLVRTFVERGADPTARAAFCAALTLARGTGAAVDGATGVRTLKAVDGARARGVGLPRGRLGDRGALAARRARQLQGARALLLRGRGQRAAHARLAAAARARAGGRGRRGRGRGRRRAPRARLGAAALRRAAEHRFRERRP